MGMLNVVQYNITVICCPNPNIVCGSSFMTIRTQIRQVQSCQMYYCAEGDV
jgi:hypothetical protein